jgi:hypothetical protein
MSTLESFSSNLFGTERCRAIVNIDPVGEHDEGNEFTKAVVKMHFADYIFIEPKVAGFPQAWKNVWERVETPFVLHLEDDWKLHKRVDLSAIIALMGKFKRLASLRLPKFPSRDGVMKNWDKWFTWNGFFYPCPAEMKRAVGFSGHPSIIRLEFIKACTPLLDVTLNPEKQFHFWNKPLIAEGLKWEYGVYGEPNSGAYIEDIGVGWRRKTGWVKKGTPAFFKEWQKQEV